jgi:hypothetical protein
MLICLLIIKYLPCTVRVKITIVIQDNNQVVVINLIEDIVYCKFMI